MPPPQKKIGPYTYVYVYAGSTNSMDEFPRDLDDIILHHRNVASSVTRPASSIATDKRSESYNTLLKVKERLNDIASLQNKSSQRYETSLAI